MNLIIITFALFFAYLTIITICYGWLPSISQSFYELKKNRLAFIFTLFLFSLSMLIIFIAKTRLMAAAGFCIIGVSIFPYFLKQKFLHYLCAVSGIVLGMISLVIDFKQPLVVLIGACIAALLHDLKVKNMFFWIEVVSFSTIIVGLWISTGMAL